MSDIEITRAVLGRLTAAGAHVVAAAAMTAPAFAQSPSVEVGLSAGLAKVGEPVAIRITINGDNASGTGTALEACRLPEVEGLDFGQPRSAGTSSFMQIDARGRRVTSVKSSYLIEVRPSGVGEYVIPPLTLTVGGAKLVRPMQAMELKIVEDLAASDLLFMERQPLPARVFEGEPYTIDLEWGWDAGLQADGLNMRLPWYGRQDGVVELELPPGGQLVDFPMGNRRVPVVRLPDVTRDGRKFRAFQMRRRFVATRPGTLEFDRSIFEFAPMPKRGSRFLRGRTQSYYRPLEGFSLEVVPVPEAGRPFEWTGAVGAIEVSRDALRRDVDAGEPIDFEITYTGEGNLEFFAAPDLARLPAFDRFRVLGVDDEKGAYERVIKYDLVPLDGSIDEVPPVPLSVFDTESESYVTLSTEPLPVRVRAVTGGDGPDPFGEKVEEDDTPPALVLRDIEARPVGAEGGRASSGWFQRGPGGGLALGALVLALVGWRALRRIVRAGGDPDSRVARRRRGALRSLERDLSKRGTDPAQLAQSLEAFLAARTNTEPGEWIGQGALAVEGASEALRQEYTVLRSALDAAIFGGGATEAPDASRVRGFARAAVKEGL